MDLGVKDKVYAIVGGVGGMGLATARLLAEEGARVAIIGRRQERGDTRAAALTSDSGSEVRMFTGDGTVMGSVESAIESAADHFGRLDGLAITAGTLQTRKSILELTDEEWDDYFQVHVMTTVRSCRAAIPHLLKVGGGTIVTTAAYSIRAQKPPLLGYATMKTAVASITKNLALTYGAEGIRANTICPGFVASESAQVVIDMAVQKYDLPPMEAVSKMMVEEFRMSVAMNRVGLPEELADLFVFLLSPRAGYLTGAVINCDGGTQF